MADTSPAPVPPTVLVTGGAGFIGSNFIRRMLARERVNIVNLDLLTYAGSQESLAGLEGNSQYSFVHGDIADDALVGRLFNEHKPFAVFNFAAESHVDRSIESADEFIRTNVVGTANLLKHSLAYWGGQDSPKQQGFRFLHVSTDEVYGSLGPTGKFTETTRYQPNSPYSASKAASDHLVRAYHSTYGLPTVISNCSNNYGPHQFPEKLIPLVTLNALEGKELPVYGDGSNVRDWLFVTDHCDALISLWRKGRPGEVYNIGGDSERSNIEVVRTICRVVDQLCPDLPHRPCESLIQFVKDRPGHDQRYAIDASKIKTEIGWQPDVTFEQGIRETVAWYLENQRWVEAVSNSENRERIGLSAGKTPSGSVAGAAAKQFVATTKPAPEYVEGTIEGVTVQPLKQFSDQRGWLIELFRNDELSMENAPVMAYVSQTEPGVVRGPHEHVEQADYFAFIGPGDFELSLWDSRPDSPTYGKWSRTTYGQSNPAAVIVPPGVVHAYKNSSNTPGWVFNAPNRLYAGPGKQEPVDEIRHEDQSNSPYRVT